MPVDPPPPAGPPSTQGPLPPMAREDRVTELEIKLSFCEDLLETLNATVVRQQGELDRLLAEVRVLREQLAAAAPGPGEARSLRDELPPHW